MAIAVFNPPEMHFTWSAERNPERPWRVDGEHTFVLRNKAGKAILRVEIADGRDMDLGSVPWIFGWLFPTNGWHLRGFAFHDEMYASQEVENRSFADFAMRFIHSIDRPRNTWWQSFVSLVQQWLIWVAVRLCGWWPWYQNKRELWHGY